MLPFRLAPANARLPFYCLSPLLIDAKARPKRRLAPLLTGDKLLTRGVLPSRPAPAKARPPRHHFAPPRIDAKARPPSRCFAPPLTGGELFALGVLPSRPVALHRS